ncbi:MAG: SIS domain-containing protein [Chloroflexi bacterium]|jgi:glucosamine--fructose-6-phosphate aminotransferase (isomerizing)|nr:SIS domain-containing protein [Chloroflexota bacterium]
MSYLEQEILEQPEVLDRLLDRERGTVETVARAIRERGPRFAVLAARGTSDNAARYGQYLLGAVNSLPVALATPSLFTLYRRPPCLADALVIAVSQSGQSPDIVAVVEEGRRQGALTLAVTNDPASPLARAAEWVIPLHAGTERSVAATKTYTASLLALGMLSAALAGDEEMFAALRTVPGAIRQVVSSAPTVCRASERYRYMEACVVVSRGYNYATAYEIALKLKELTYVLAEPYSSADFQHGPVALVEKGFPVIAVVPEGAVTAEMVDFLRRLREREAELVVISAREEVLSLAQTPLPLPEGIPEWLSPMVAVVPGQLFALGLTQARGLDPDQPRGLQKVTRTE